MLTSVAFKNINIVSAFSLLIIWSAGPFISYLISSGVSKKVTISKDEKEIINDLAFRTWKYFDEFMIESNNYLPPDNYQSGRRNKLTVTTSSTNIGLGLIAIITAYDLKYITKEEALKRLKKSLDVIFKLEKWNGHLYNWYNIKTLAPLNPRFVSTVDSGNFIGYLFCVKEFLTKNNELEYEKSVSNLINETDFSKLFDFDKKLFSIGYDFVEKSIVDSYYDLLASEARLASFIAICKGDVPYKHWFSMNRALTYVDRYKGLTSWSGTMFEYFMPLIVMKSYQYTLLDETYDFCIYSQRKYARKLNIPWGISESAFNLQDANNNYQYKAFGIPWLGLKRGLKDEVVVSPYSSIMAISKSFKASFDNIENMKKFGAYDKYGFYDAIDFTPSRLMGEKYEVVKTYMAHHLALILISLNNFLNDNIMQKRFMDNPEIRSGEILLEERVPTNVIITKSRKEKVKVLKYTDYEENDDMIVESPVGNVNIQSNNDYTLVINDFGRGYAKYKDILITKYSEEEMQGNVIYIKDLEGKINISSTPMPIINEDDNFECYFSSYETKFIRSTDALDVTTRIAVDPENNVEVRIVEVANVSSEEINLELISFLEPVLALENNDAVHPAYNNLFIRSEKYQNAVLLEKRIDGEKIYLMNYAISEDLKEPALEMDKSKVIGRLNSIRNPQILNGEIPYSNEALATLNTVVSYKFNFKLLPEDSKKFCFFNIVGNNLESIKSLYEKFDSLDKAKKTFELAKSKSLVENRFLGFKGKDILLYNKLFSLINSNDTRKKYQGLINENTLSQSSLWRFGVSGDLPIILVKIKKVNDAYMLKDVMRAIEYYNIKRLSVDLIILNEEPNSYEQYVGDKIIEIIGRLGLNFLIGARGGIHIIKKCDINSQEEKLILSASDIILNARDGFLKEQLYE